MDVVITCHTEFGFVSNKEIIFDKRNKEGTRKGVQNLAHIADAHGAKVTFAVCPEVAEYVPRQVPHEIGLHIHPGWQEYRGKNFSWMVGDSFLREHCKQSSFSTVLRDYSFEEQSGMIKAGKAYVENTLHQDVNVFVAGRWSLNNDTIQALTEQGITHECSAVSHAKKPHYDWSKLPRICMPYHPSTADYQQRGNLPILMVPISQVFPGGNANIESIPRYGFGWLKACFEEYYMQDAPLFHICLHSPAMTDLYFTDTMNRLLAFISSHRNICFAFASEIKEYPQKNFKTNIMPYIPHLNKEVIYSGFKKIFTNT